MNVKSDGMDASTAMKGAKIDGFTARVAEVEEWLQGFKVSYSHLLDLPLERINVQASRSNQARPTPVVRESVDRFTASLKSGAKFPPVVGYLKTRGGKVVLIDGNNRDAAYRAAGYDRIPAFVLPPDTPSETILAMTVAANANHGVTPPLEWRLVQANQLCDLGFDRKDAAQYAGVTPAQLHNYHRSVAADVRSDGLKISGFKALPTSTKLTLAPIRDDAVFQNAARIVIETGMTSEDARAMVRELTPLGSEQERLQFLMRKAEERKAHVARMKAGLKAHGHVKNPKQGLITALGKIDHADISAILKVALNDGELHSLAELCDARALKLMELASSLREAARTMLAGG